MSDRTAFSVAAPPAFVVLWSSAFIAGVLGVGAATPMLVLVFRFAIAGVLLVGYALMVRATWPTRRELGHVVIAGLLMQAVQFGAFYTAMSYQVPASIIALVQGLNPVLIALLAAPILGERVSRRQWIGLSIGGIGVGVAVAEQADFSVAGLLLCVVGLLGIGVGTVYQKRFTPAVDSRAATAVHTVASAPVVGVLALALGDQTITDPGGLAASVAWMVVVNSMAAFLLLNSMLGRWETTKVSRLFFATPGVTALMAWLLVGQPVGIATIVGLIIAGVGMLFATAAGPTARERRDEPVPAVARTG